MAMTSKEIRDYFRSATQGVHAAKGRRVTYEMMEREELDRTIKKVRRALPVRATSGHILRKFNSVSK